MENVVDRQIMWGDLDALGIVFYPRYSEWIDASAHLYFEALGVPMDRLWQERHLLFGLVETRCNFKSPGRYHQNIRIATKLIEIGTKSLTLRHRFHFSCEDVMLLEGIEKRACMDVSDPGAIQAVPIPEDLREILAGALD